MAFLLDKYRNDDILIKYQNEITDHLIKSFNNHNNIENNIIDILDNINDNKDVINELVTNNLKFQNFQHLIVYGLKGSSKRMLIDRILENIYGNIKIDNVEYTINGYGNTKSKVTVKQSKNHIIIEPNNNGFDKYLIQEIIQEYARTENLKIFKQNHLFKVVIIDTIDNLSYTAQASLRRTMEKYGDRCKFIFVCDQLSNIIEPLISRCLLIRIPLPSREEIIEIISYISIKENINLTCDKINFILDNCENKINNAIWLLEFFKLEINYDNDWKDVVENTIDLILNYDFTNNKKMVSFINQIRENFYILFVTNINIKDILLLITKFLIEKTDDIKLKYEFINIISKFESNITSGTRYIVHYEGMVLELIELLNKYKEYKKNIF